MDTLNRLRKIARGVDIVLRDTLDVIEFLETEPTTDELDMSYADGVEDGYDQGHAAASRYFKNILTELNENQDHHEAIINTQLIQIAALKGEAKGWKNVRAT